MSRRKAARGALRFAWGLSKGIQRGDLFPAAGRWRPPAAPGGSTEAFQGRRPWRRARDEAGWFSESHHQVDIPGLGAPLTLLHLTDVHLRGEGPWLDALCAALQALEPADLIVLTGDLVTRGWTPAAVGRFLGALPPARLGRFAVMGNWEHWSGAAPGPWRRQLDENGVRLLINEEVDLGAFRLFGTDDALAGQPELPPSRPGDPRPRVVLTHSPAFFDRLAGPDADLALAGHSHAGQVRLPGLGAAWVPMGTGPYVGGWYARAGSQLYVGRGIGWSIAPLRMWCAPELARIGLDPAPGAQKRHR